MAGDGDEGSTASCSPTKTRTNHFDLEAQPSTSDSPVRNVHTHKSDSSDIAGRRPKRSNTSKSYRPKYRGRVWKPGQEPGIDPAGSHPSSTPVALKEKCEISVVDFSQYDMQVRYLDNTSLPAFLESSKEEGMTCRWINVNGLSWDVISLLGREFGFHRLAIEDLLNRKSRTKADWYTDHTYSKIPLQYYQVAP